MGVVKHVFELIVGLFFMAVVVYGAVHYLHVDANGLISAWKTFWQGTGVP